MGDLELADHIVTCAQSLPASPPLRSLVFVGNIRGRDANAKIGHGGAKGAESRDAPRSSGNVVSVSVEEENVVAVASLVTQLQISSFMCDLSTRAGGGYILDELMMIVRDVIQVTASGNRRVLLSTSVFFTGPVAKHAAGKKKRLGGGHGTATGRPNGRAGDVGYGSPDRKGYGAGTRAVGGANRRAAGRQGYGGGATTSTSTPQRRPWGAAAKR